MKKLDKRKGNALITALLVVIFVLGLGLLIYPTFSDWWNSMHQSRAVSGYVEEVSELSTEDKIDEVQRARAYNQSLVNKPLSLEMEEEEAEIYDGILDVTGTGIMAYIEIPKIHVQLPIYHGTEDTVLQIAIGHLAGTSFPVGGVGSHAVLSGHRGLPSAKLFTNLDKLKVKDTFLIRVMDEVLTYEVDQILIVEPNQTEALAIDPNEDYCTLVTCTPYGVNTHRLLVRGHRIETEEQARAIMVPADATQIEPLIMAPLVAAPMLVILFVYVMITGGRKKGQTK